MIDGRYVLVALPMRDHHPLTREVVRRLVADDEFDELVIYDNGSESKGSITWLRRVEAGAFGPKVKVRRRKGNGVIYKIWNEAWDLALRIGIQRECLVDLAILNNDIVVPEGFLGHLSRALRGAHDDVWVTYPDYHIADVTKVSVSTPPVLTATSGTWRRGGMAGFAFMMKPEKHLTHDWPFIDERFRWYYGDGDLVNEMQVRGATAARVEGLPVRHGRRKTSHDKRNSRWVRDAAAEDSRQNRRKWHGRGSRPTWEKRWKGSDNASPRGTE